MRVSLSEAPRATGAHGAHRPHLGAPSEQKERKGQEMDARGKHDFPFPNTGSLSLPLWVFVPFLAMKGLRNRVQDLGALCKATRTRLPRPLFPSTYELQQHLGASTALYSLRPSPGGRVGASVALPPPHTPFPRIQHPIARTRLAGDWQVIPHLLVLWRIIIVDVGYSADTPVH